MSGGKDRPIHAFFFPFMAPGHMIPMADMAKLFAVRGCRSTIISIPSCEPVFSRSIDKARSSGLDIGVAVVRLPLEEVGLSQEHDDIRSLMSSPDVRGKFLMAVRLLEEPLGKLLEEQRPNCLVSDVFLSWTTEVAARFGVPRLAFHGTGYFSLGASECVQLYKPHEEVKSDSEPFVIPNFPGEITMTRSKLPDFIRKESQLTKLYNESKDSEKRSYGIIINSFYELEPAYADHYREFLGRRAWHIGPISSCNKEIEDKNESSVDQDCCLSFLDSKEPSSVIYVCFGSMANFGPSQLHEIAVGLDRSGYPFVWVVKRDPSVEDGKEEWLPKGYKERMANRGLILRGWAPQVPILEHKALGAFVTHCGWNSTLEAVSAGVPMVTWPISAEQFYNEELIARVLRIGIPVGIEEYTSFMDNTAVIGAEAVERAVTRIMAAGEEGEAMRGRSRGLAEMAKRAVQDGGSSYSDLNALLQQLKSQRTKSY